MLGTFNRAKKHLIPLLFCVNLAVFYLYDYLLRVMPSVLSNGLQEAYHLSFLSYGFLCTTFYLIYVPMQLVIGLLVDRVQLNQLMLGAILLCALGGCLFANAKVFYLALVGRLLMGLGASCVLVSILKVIATRVSEGRFTLYLGVVICVGMLGGLLMDSLLVFIFKQWGWRLASFFVTLVGLVLVIVHLLSGNHRRNSVFSGCHLAQEFNQLKTFLANRRLWLHCLIGALLYLPMAGFAESWGIYFIKQASQLSHLSASLDMSLLFLGFALGAPLLGWLYDRTDQYQQVLAGGAVGVTILLSVVLYVPELSGLEIGVTLFLLGFFSSSIVVILALSRKLAPKEEVGKVFAVTNFFIMLAGGGAWLIGGMIHFIVRHALLSCCSFASLSSFQLAFMMLPLASVLALFLSFYVYDHNT